MNNKNHYLKLYNFKCVYNNSSIKEIKHKIYCIIYDIYGIKLYKGYIKNGIPNGYGILYKHKKVMYIGNFKNGKIIDNKFFFDINEKKCNKKYYKYDSYLFNSSNINVNHINIYVKQININKKISIFKSIKNKLLFFNYNIKNNNPLKKLYYFIKHLVKTEINILDLKIIFLFIYIYNINNNINIHNEILIKFIKLPFYKLTIYIKKIKKKNQSEKNTIINNDILNNNFMIICNYINNLCLDYTNKNNNKISINLDNINIKLYNYTCKKEYYLLLDTLKLKKNTKCESNIDTIINIFFIKLKNINNIININKKYSSSNNSSSTNSINSKSSNSNISSNSDIEIDDIYLTAKLKKLFIIEKDDILIYNKFMLSIYKKLIYKIKYKYKSNNNNNKKNNNYKKNKNTKKNLIKSNSCKDIILLYNNGICKDNTINKINNIKNIKNYYNNKLNIFDKDKKNKQIEKLFKNKLNSIRLEIEQKYEQITDEEWISYLNLMHKYLPISIKKRIYTKTISTQTLLTETQTQTQTNLYNNIKNIKLLKKNLIEKTYV
jgi:hypothetical protein